jgi:deoxycytidylate deaminase
MSVASSVPAAGGPELVFGLVGPVGVDISGVQEALTTCLREVNYTSEVISVTRWLEKRLEASGRPVPTALDERIHLMQEQGNALRKKLSRGDAMAAVAVTLIRESRQGRVSTSGHAASRHAYIVRQLKHPEEVHRLREVYGASFSLIGMYENDAARKSRLTADIAASREKRSKQAGYAQGAEELIARDMAEEDRLGQKVRDTFPLADLFLHTHERHVWLPELRRFIELVFGNELRTPRPEEYLMFQARSVALRSGDLSRQVGAVIASTDGSVIAVGMNDVPRVGGRWFIDGQSPDRRDLTFDADRSEHLKRETLAEILERLRANGFLSRKVCQRDPSAVLKDVVPLMEGTRLMGIGEFGRTVHAEMAALLDAAKRGVAVKNAILFSTTFPCQNCAKHIIASGIQVVVYMDPYPKSLTDILHEDVKHGPMLTLNELQHAPVGEDTIYFGTYLGVAPRMYMQLFPMRKRRDAEGNVIKWAEQAKMPRLVPSDDPAIIEREKACAALLTDA